ncbi:hypothetical protein WL29_21485 [Burkholderia ubonensis]|uniref:Uncharacterized protein n=1 Tax=Burkholderia ubonensis TaxID=101571 RepID=A0A125DMC7_9BURK|nr:hypothetical protein [Burkholderia ubonensis]KWA83942.1 hypothetical protein WL29_21485 [Burkholderia ubonensis]
MKEQTLKHAPRAESCRQFLQCLAQINHLPSIFILKLGRDWFPQALPADVPRGPQRQCYENAGTLVLRQPELSYVEGYACPPGLIPVHHAWCVDAHGRVIDNTLSDPANSLYFGVPFTRDLLWETISDTKHWGLLAEHMTPAMLYGYLKDVQAGAWPAENAAATEVGELLRQFLHD